MKQYQDFSQFLQNSAQISEDLLDTLIDLTQDSYVFLEDLENCITWWSKSAQDLLQLPSRYEKNSMQKSLEKIHPDDRDYYIQEYTLRKMNHNMDSSIMYRVLAKDNTYHFFSSKTAFINDSNGKPRYFIGVLKDNNRYPEIDALTDLFSQSMYTKEINNLIKKQIPFSILKISIDKFANLNTAYGIPFGDKVLREIAFRFILLMDSKSKVFRIEGAKFAFIFQNNSRNDLICFEKKIRSLLTNDFTVDDKKITLKMTSGAILVEDTNIDADTICENVTYAAKQSQSSSQGDLVIFNDIIQTKDTIQMNLLRVIHESVRNHCDGFYLLYQPIVSSDTGKINGAEALIRWKKEPFGNVPPGMFIEWLENDPAMYDLGNFVLRTALSDGLKFLSKIPDFILNVNISIRQLERHEFRDSVVSILQETGYPGSHLCFELTERCKGMDLSFLEQEVIFFKSLGIRIAIDDYGTGSASTSIVMQIPVDEIKIDMSFIRGITENQKKKSMVKGIIDFANYNGMTSCIEGVEDKSLEKYLRSFHATWFQGYLYSKPITAEELLDYIDHEGEDF